MASRQEEKEARRKARLEQEAAERRAAARRKRLQLLLGGVVALAVVAALVVVITSGGGGAAGSGGGAKTPERTGVKLPAVKIADGKQAAKAAGCTLKSPADAGREHANKAFTAKDYKTNPPTSGTHSPTPAQDGIYTPANTPPLGDLMHALEHSRISVQYKPGTSAPVVKQLEELLAESNGGYHMILFQNPTGMDAQVAATAWNYSLTCPKMNDRVFDAIRAFRQAHIDRGPEQVP